jgi:hypothetical protein
VALRLNVPVGVGRLADARVAKPLLDPPQVSAVAQQPGGEGVSGGVMAAVRELRLGQKRKRLLDLLEELRVAGDSRPSAPQTRLSNKPTRQFPVRRVVRAPDRPETQARHPLAV